MKTLRTFMVADGLGAQDRILYLAAALLCLAGLDLAPAFCGQTTPTSTPAAAPPARLTILGDNTVARDGVKAVWGFACLVEAHGHTVLFDTGADPAVLKDNLTATKVDPTRIEAVVISHYHGDHTWGAPGLGTLQGVRAFIPRSFEGHPQESAALRSAGLMLVPVSQATPLFDGIAVSEPVHFDGRIPFGAPGQEFTDELWEQCLTVDTPAGLIVIVGCSHPGILPMLERVKRQTGRPLYFVIGGFHLLGQSDAQVRRIAQSMEALGVVYVGATHCTGEAAAHVFHNVFGDHYVSAGVGAVIDLPSSATSAVPASAQSPLDRIAESYVKLVLAIGQHSSDFVDAYFGPPQWQTAATRDGKRPLAELISEADRLLAAVATESAGSDRSLRRDFLAGQLAATRAYLGMLAGRKLPFDEEAKALFAVEPPHDDLASFEHIQTQIAALLPGDGPVSTRYFAWRKRLVVPRDKIAVLFDAAAREARQRTAAHVTLPAGESFDLSVVTGKPWGAYNWYRGQAHSLIEINADTPFFIEKAIDFAAHEGYPGHHVFMSLRESELFRKQGQVEHAIYPLFSPLSLISEGCAQAGIRLAFPEADRLAFERNVLFPLAGLPPDEAKRYTEIRRLVKSLEKADVTLARRLLDGNMSEAQVKDWLLVYGLRTSEEADKAIEFFRAYRSYVVNYSVGEDLVTQWLDARAGTDSAKRWAVFLDLITSPRLPAALQLRPPR